MVRPRSATAPSRVPPRSARRRSPSSFLRKLRSDSVSQLRDNGGAATADQAPLGASDIAILIPLTASAAGDSYFGFGGTGVCNLPQLSDGASSDPVMSQDIFRQLAKDVFRVITPLPDVTNTGLWRSTPTAAQLAQNDPANLPDSDTCARPAIASIIRGDADQALLGTYTHMAAIQGIQRESCGYTNWRIVAARFEPCPQLPDYYQAGATGTSGTSIGAYDVSKCGKPVLRLTAQAFSSLTNSQVTVVDMAMHLFYEVDDIQAILTDLRALAQATSAKIAAGAGTIAALPTAQQAYWQNPDPRVLTAHPGLALEMNCGTATTGPVGPVAQAFWQVISKYATGSHLEKITWMTSNDGSRDHWTMGTRIVTSGTVHSDTQFNNENFSMLANRGGRFPFGPFDQTTNNIGAWYPLASLQNNQANLQMLFDIVNPLKVNFFYGGAKGASCLSCHLHDQTVANVQNTIHQTNLTTYAQGQGVTDMYPPPTSIWPPFVTSQFLRNRDMSNLRNFGYSVGMRMNASVRVLNEVDVARDFIARYVSSAQPSGGGSGAIGTGDGHRHRHRPRDDQDDLGRRLDALHQLSRRQQASAGVRPDGHGPGGERLPPRGRAARAAAAKRRLGRPHASRRAAASAGRARRRRGLGRPSRVDHGGDRRADAGSSQRSVRAIPAGRDARRDRHGDGGRRGGRAGHGDGDDAGDRLLSPAAVMDASGPRACRPSSGRFLSWRAQPSPGSRKTLRRTHAPCYTESIRRHGIARTGEAGKMKRLTSLLPTLVLPLALAGCSGTGASLAGLGAALDQWSFQTFGSTLVSSPDTLTLKEIHLDVGTLTGREVVVEGKVVGASDHGTYLVLSDDAARMLVLLTDLDRPGAALTGDKARTVRVLGVVESGKKGLPVVRAHALQAIDTKA